MLTFALFFAIVVVVLQGKLSGYGVEEQLPTIAIVAHYDAFGAAPVRERIVLSFFFNVYVLRETAKRNSLFAHMW